MSVHAERADDPRGAGSPSDAGFDSPAAYDAMLQRGLRLTGEDKAFYLRHRLHELCRRLPEGFRPERVLDYGCGIGDGSRALAVRFGPTRVVGVDTSRPAVEYARRRQRRSDVSFYHVDEVPTTLRVDLCYVNGVFHHVPPEDRAAGVAWIRARLRAGGYLVVFENNPWNPGARIVMRRIPFDRDARMVGPGELRELVRAGGFRIEAAGSLFYFPRWLAPLRPFERRLRGVPLGAQHYVLAAA